MSISEPQVLIIELGGQLTQKIGKVLRESAEVRSAILDPASAAKWLMQNTPKAIILSGSGKSVNDEDAPAPPEVIFSLRNSSGDRVPILGICYGMQYLAKRFGGEVSPHAGEYGESRVEITRDFNGLFSGVPRTSKVWMSHGDSVTICGRGFEPMAFSPGCVAAMGDRDRNIYAVQFHPEATQTTHGAEILSNFVLFAGCTPDWQPWSLADSIREEVLEDVGTGKVALPWSGGVDSTTLVWILREALGARLLYFNIDGNQLRQGELEEIRMTAKFMGGNFSLISAHERFSAIMAQSAHGPTKRKYFQVPYGDLLKSVAREFGATHIPQGTLAPDLIESGKTGGAQIVQHHNDLEIPGCTMLHPMRHLFKYEVRALAKALGLPEYIYNRQPFPGPGLYIRIIGGLATPENIDIVRWADAKATQITKAHGVYDEISQLVVGYDLTHTSGVKGDGPYSAGSIIVRPFKTWDFMTGEGYFLSEPIMKELQREITKHPAVCRVWFDYNSKPSARTELQ